MKKILLIIAGVVAVAVVAVLLFAATRPDTFHVQRVATINAPPEKIYPLIADFQAWSGWSPWEKKDPAMKRSFSGPASGKGAVYAWDGNSEVGQGSMEIVEDTPPSQLMLNLDFVKPFEGHNVVTFTLAPQGEATYVTWTMEGASPFITKVIGLFCDMDSMIGKEFETGLANLKTLAEK
jgi:uncharacterized protein YndB with AHSA1/START domain